MDELLVTGITNKKTKRNLGVNDETMEIQGGVKRAMLFWCHC